MPDEPLAAVPPATEPEAPKPADPQPRRRGTYERGEDTRQKQAQAMRESHAARRTGKPSASMKARSAVLRRELEQLLAMPAIPAAMLTPDREGKAYMSWHFGNVGPHTARELVDASESSPALREALEKLMVGNATVTIVIAIGIYLGGPVMYVLGMRAQAIGLSSAALADPTELAAQVAASMAADAAAASEDQGAQGAENGSAQSPQDERSKVPPAAGPA